MRWIRISFLCAALALTGCASQRLVDSDVQSYSHLTALPATPTYQFERLPSQQAQEAAQSAIETAAAQALAKVGLRWDGTAPAFRAEVYARTDRTLSPDWDEPWGWNGRGAWGGWGGWGGRGFYGGLALRFPPPTLYRREVGLILREAASGKVAYETHAMHEGLWSDNTAIFGAMFDAALSGFPVPPQGPRRVNIEIPR